MTRKRRPLRSWGDGASRDEKKDERKKSNHGSRTVPISSASDNPYRFYTESDRIKSRDKRRKALQKMGFPTTSRPESETDTLRKGMPIDLWKGRTVSQAACENPE
jgi:hypothetical protein